MKSNLRNLLYLFLLVCLTSAFVLVERPETAVENFLFERKIASVLTDYADKNVVWTLSRLVRDIETLDTAAHRLRAAPTDAAANETASAWRAARTTWKLTEAFGFGPTAYYNFDKQLDTWPLDRPLVDHTLEEMAAGHLTLDARYLREQVYSTRRGFLAVEYLLFRDGRPRQARDMRTEELDYLATATETMHLEASDFLAAWIGTGSLPTARAEALASAGMRPRTAYAFEFKNPGDYRSRYVSASVPLQEILQDAATVAEDLCPAIAAVLGSTDPRASETPYSRNGVADLRSRLQGIENAYLGGWEGRRGHSVSELVSALDEVLDRRVRIALADTAHRIASVGDPYTVPTEDRPLAVRRAVSACDKLVVRLGMTVPLVTMHPSARPWVAYGVWDMPSMP